MTKCETCGWPMVESTTNDGWRWLVTPITMVFTTQTVVRARCARCGHVSVVNVADLVVETNRCNCQFDTDRDLCVNLHPTLSTKTEDEAIYRISGMVGCFACNWTRPVERTVTVYRAQFKPVKP